MKTLRFVLFAFLALTLIVGNDLWAQRGGGPGRDGRKGMQGGCCGPRTAFNRMYDVSSVETITGEVLSVDTVASFRGIQNGIHLTLKTDQGELPVHLGPAWYLKDKNLKIGVHDKITAKGSRVTIDDKPALVAAEVRMGETNLKLRNDNGTPLWSGKRGRR